MEVDFLDAVSVLFTEAESESADINVNEFDDRQTRYLRLTVPYGDGFEWLKPSEPGAPSLLFLSPADKRKMEKLYQDVQKGPLQ